MCKLTLANLYILFSAASEIALASKSIQTISPFSSGDATILYIHSHPDSLKAVDKMLKDILGDKSKISSPLTFYEKFKGIVKFFSEFSNIFSTLVLGIAIAITILSILSLLNQKKQEFGILKAIGWTPDEISRLIIKDIFLICFIGGVLGIIGSYIVIKIMSLITVNIEIPWEMSFSTPHFLMKNPDEKIIMPVRLPVSISWILCSGALIITCITGIISGYLTGKKINKIKPVEAIRNGL